MTSREYTVDEVRDQFLEHCAHMVNYWLNETRSPDVREKLQGLVHSFLVMLDGCSANLPGFIVAPSVHPGDKAYHQENDENWYQEFPDVEVQDIAGSLHDDWYKVLRRLGMEVK